MTSTAALEREASASIRACTICRDVQNFDLLIEDMEVELGDAWGDLGFDTAGAYLSQPEAEDLEFVAIAMNEDDEEHVEIIADLIRHATDKGVKVVVIAEEVSPMVLHQLLKLGAAEFVPYPLPEGALHDAVMRMSSPPAEPQRRRKTDFESADDDKGARIKPKSDRDGVLMAVHGLAGGVGATTFAVNLAWELATIDEKAPPRVCLIDLGLQTGAVSTYLDLSRREAVYELLSDTEAMDSESFLQALLPFEEKLHVLTAPAEMLPLDLVTPDDIERILEIARANFDYVVVDLPGTIVQWTETVLSAAHVFFALLEIDLRSAQNALRLIRALKAEDLPVEKLRFLLNRAPKFTDLSGKSRVKRLAENLDIKIEVQLPDGGRQVSEAGDRGEPLALAAKKNPLRREVRKLAQSVHDLNRDAAVEA